jgi:hypothetical protein
MEKVLKTYLLIVGLLFLGCKDKFNPTVTTSNNNILVVEGFINAGADSTIIKLSRTVVLAKENTVNAETAATVTVESDANEAFNLGELALKKGTYAALGLNLNPGKKYRLRIKTTNGATYLSDFVEVKLSPAIDKIAYDIKGDDGIDLYINTHDATNKARYYRWEYDETWIFYATFKSKLMWNGTQLVTRDQNNNIYQCWGNSKSSTIVLGSSAKLDQDVIFKQPLTFIPSSSEKLTERYSVLVKQYALTKDAYDFWQNLKKNTESLGSIFDAQPSQLVGNIHNINNAEEPVIGYIGVGSVQQQRIYINYSELPRTYKVAVQTECYPLLEVFFLKPDDPRGYFGSGVNIPIDLTANGALSSGRACADCTIRGVNKKPAFWQ